MNTIDRADISNKLSLQTYQNLTKLCTTRWMKIALKAMVVHVRKRFTKYFRIGWMVYLEIYRRGCLRRQAFTPRGW